MMGTICGAGRASRQFLLLRCVCSGGEKKVTHLFEHQGEEETRAGREEKVVQHEQRLEPCNVELASTVRYR